MGTPGAADGDRVAVYRTATGWRVTGLPAGAGDTAATLLPAAPETLVDDLLSAIVLADLLSAVVAPETIVPGARPAAPVGELDETGRLRVAVAQLQHALAARVVVEQAIGVLAERSGISPREAFEALRKVARSRGRKVHDVSVDVVASVTDPSVALPGGLPARPR
jgi:hypothetical protein